jgi:tetratricopeptide (TPR) repeat protein
LSSILIIPSLDSGSASYWLQKGNELCNASLLTEALKAYDMALSLDSTLVNAWNNKGMILAHMGRHKEALECFDEALKSDPNASTA